MPNALRVPEPALHGRQPQLADPPREESPLGLELRQLQRGLVFRDGLVHSTETAQQIRANGMSR